MESVILTCNPTPGKFAEIPQRPPNPKISFRITQTKPEPKIINAHVAHLCKTGRLEEAIASLDQCGFKVKLNTLSYLIQSCIDIHSLELGRELHARIDNFLQENPDPFIQTKLVSMYAKCGSLEDAFKLFDKMSEKNLYTWSAMIGACSRERRWGAVLELFALMMDSNAVPDEFLLPKILQACGNYGDLDIGRSIHSIAVKCGLMKRELRVNNSILAVYAKCGCLSDAQRFFDSMNVKDRVSWNTMITGYCQNGNMKEARRLFGLMCKEGIEPGLITWNILISRYNQLGKCDVAMEMMEEMEHHGVVPDVFTWTCMISGLAQNNKRTQALELFRKMVLEGVEPNGVTLTSVISACAALKDLTRGMEFHMFAVKAGLGEEVLVGNALIDMYSKCGKLEDAQRVFDMLFEKDVYTWNSMIGAYCQAGYCGKAYDLFVKMQEAGVSPNVITWNVMITGYIQNGDEDEAMELFQKMEKDGRVKRDTASWNALIAGYSQNGQKDKALGIFRQMQSFCMKPNSVTILSILPSCSNLIAGKKVKEIQGCVLRRNLESDLSVANSLIDAYAKSGNIRYSKSVFDGMSTKDIISWNTMIAGFVLHGRPRDANELADQMIKVGIRPNRGTFVSMISACGLAKMVDEGKRIFSIMSDGYSITPCLDHCAAMIKLYGRSGMLEDALGFIEKMTIQPDSSIWDSFLTACRVHGNPKLAVRAGEQLLELDPGNASARRLLLQLYSLSGIPGDSLAGKRPGRNETKESLGRSWIEIKKKVYSFSADRNCHSNVDVLSSWVKRMTVRTKELDDNGGLCIEEEEKEDAGGIHSEKLAFAFALLNFPQDSQIIRIVKNIRTCRSCHNTAKYISKVHECEIYLNDSKCLHHFKDGQCSCGDYW